MPRSADVWCASNDACSGSCGFKRRLVALEPVWRFGERLVVIKSGWRSQKSTTCRSHSSTSADDLCVGNAFDDFRRRCLFRGYGRTLCVWEPAVFVQEP